MEANMEHFPAMNPNPVLSVGKDGTVLYSNNASEPLLHEWGVTVGEKLPSIIEFFVQRVISGNNPEKMEVKAGKKVYLVAFHPLPEEECVNIYGFDISDLKQLEMYSNIVETANEGILIIDAEHRTTYANEKMADMLGCSREEIIGKSVRDFTDDEGKAVFEMNMEKRRRGIDETHEIRLIRKDGSLL
jgi:PAS domain S-box-containing protein